MDIKQFKEEYFGSDPSKRTVDENWNKLIKGIYKAMAKGLLKWPEHILQLCFL